MNEGGPSGDAELTWHPIPVPLPAEGLVCGFELAGHPLLLCNALGEPRVLLDECPHAGVALSGGRLRGTVLECPLHGGKLDVRDGAPMAFPIRRSASCFPVRSSGGGLEVGVPRSGGQ